VYGSAIVKSQPIQYYGTVMYFAVIESFFNIGWNYGCSFVPDPITRMSSNGRGGCTAAYHDTTRTRGGMTSSTIKAAEVMKNIKEENEMNELGSSIADVKQKCERTMKQ